MKYISSILIVSILLFTTSVSSEKISFWKSIELVRKSNPYLIARKFEIDKARSDIITASLYPNPLFNNQTLVKLKYKEPGGPLNAVNRQDWHQLTQSFPVAGQRESAIELARRNLEFTQNNHLEFERNLLFLVMSKWIDAWFFREKFKTLEKGKNFLDELVKVNLLRYKNQVITKTELERTRILAEQYAIEMNNQEQYALNSEQSLKFLYGIESNIELEDRNFFKEISIKDDVNEFIKYARDYRADILTANSARDVSQANLHLQEANAYPRPEAGFIYNPQNGDNYFGTYVTIPIPINNRNQGNIQKARVDLEQSDKEITATVGSIETEVINVYREYKLYKSNFNKYKEIVKESDDIRHTVQYSYLKGGTTVVDYLEAQRNWLQTQIASLENQSQYRRGYLQLLFVTGLIQEEKK
jgi:cobalt-zinc-cadmium efflux system outer membrane protein